MVRPKRLAARETIGVAEGEFTGTLPNGPIKESNPIPPVPLQLSTGTLEDFFCYPALD